MQVMCVKYLTNTIFLTLSTPHRRYFSIPVIEFIRSIPDIAIQNFSADAVFRFLRCGFSELLDSEIDVLENYVLACGVRGKSAWDKKWVRLPKHKAGYDLELLNQSREYIMELLKPVYQVFSDKKSTVKDYVLAIYKLICFA